MEDGQRTARLCGWMGLQTPLDTARWPRLRKRRADGAGRLVDYKAVNVHALLNQILPDKSAVGFITRRPCKKHVAVLPRQGHSRVRAGSVSLDLRIRVFEPGSFLIEQPGVEDDDIH